MDKATEDKTLDRPKDQRGELPEAIGNSRDAEEFDRECPPDRPYRFTEDRLRPYEKALQWLYDFVQLIGFVFRVLRGL